MRTIVATTAKLALLGAVFLLGFVDLTAPSYASGYGYGSGCHYKTHCPGSRHVLAGSVGLFPSRCNGELGFWLPVTFANGETLCIAQSTADFYHNGELVPTCTTKTKVEGRKVYITTDGACPAKKHKGMEW